MTLLIDPPRWPAHGTVFSHLVSDTSLDELHRFAAAAGLSRRAFDRDHYDVPLQRYDDLVQAGAVEVSGGELVRRLVASGLRVRAADRPEHLAGVLSRRMDRLLPEIPAAARGRLTDELMTRWSQPHRHYHDQSHLLAVLQAVDLLLRHGADSAGQERAVKLAAWFHDAVYAADPSRPAGQDEEDSAVLAEQLLDDLGLPRAEVAETARLVRLTAQHDPAPGDAAGALLCDADLEVLGRGSAEYARYLDQVRQDFASVPDGLFADGRLKVVRQLLALDPIYRTDAGRELWEQSARRNLESELMP